MVRLLFKEKQQDILVLLQKGCSLRKTEKTLHLHSICKSSEDAKLSLRGRPRKLASVIKRSCISNLA